MRCNPITPEIITYIEQNFCDKALPDAKAIRGDGDRSEVQVSAIEGRFIQLILQLSGAKKVIEVGTMHGYSSAWILAGLPADGSLITIEKSTQAYAQAVSNIGQHQQVQLINQDAMQFLRTLPEASYDAIFIDANKSGYPDYLEQAARLLKPGGVMLVDDALLFAELWLNCNNIELSSMHKGVAEFNRKLSESRFFQGLLLPMLHGVAFAIRSDAAYNEK